MIFSMVGNLFFKFFDTNFCIKGCFVIFFCSSFFNEFAKASLVLGATRLTSHRDSIEAY